MSLVVRRVLGMFVVATWMAAAPVGAEQNIQDHAAAMVKDAEDMVAHGGMGDAKAIVHHCGEVSKHAQAILHGLPQADSHAQAAAPHLQAAIEHCRKVAAMGDKVDPGASLNPAAKARTAVREAAKHLAMGKAGGA